MNLADNVSGGVFYYEKIWTGAAYGVSASCEFPDLIKQAAQVAGTMATTDNSKTILVDAGHGGL